MPYNFTFPETQADLYTMEATTLNDTFILKADQQKKAVYAWTVNDSEVLSKMLFMDVAGVITDDLELVNEEVNDFEKSIVCGSYFALYFYATKCGFSIKNEEEG